jgi:hypothetical protein
MDFRQNHLTLPYGAVHTFFRQNRDAGVVTAFPVVEATNTGNTSSNSGSFNVPLPASIVSGNLLLVFITIAKDSGITLNTPSGWGDLFALGTANGNLRIFAGFYRTADGSEGATQTFSLASSDGAWATTSMRISGWQGTPEAATIATGSSANPDCPSLTPSWGSAKTLWLAVAGNRDDDSYTVSPTNYTNLIQGQATHNQGSTTAVTRRELEATSDDPSAYTIAASEPWATTTVAIRPA